MVFMGMVEPFNLTGRINLFEKKNHAKKKTKNEI